MPHLFLHFFIIKKVEKRNSELKKTFLEIRSKY